MKRYIKVIISSFFTIILLFMVGCNGEDGSKKSNIEILKEYMLMDENVCLINKVGGNDVAALLNPEQTIEQYSKQYIYKKKDNRVQYIMENVLKIGNTENNRIESYVIEFREDGIYTSEKRNNYDKVEDVEDLIDKVDNTYFDKLFLKMPLEVGTTWEYNKAGDGTYKITKFDGENIEIELKSNSPTITDKTVETYKKGVGFSAYICTTENGDIISAGETEVQKK